MCIKYLLFLNKILLLTKKKKNCERFSSIITIAVHILTNYCLFFIPSIFYQSPSMTFNSTTNKEIIFKKRRIFMHLSCSSKLLKTQGSTIVRLKRCLSALNLKKIKEGTKVWQLVLAMKREISYFKYSENSKNESIHAHKHMWCSSSCKRHKEAQLWCQKLVNALNLQKIKESMIIRQLVWVMKTNPSLKPLKELKK